MAPADVAVLGDLAEQFVDDPLQPRGIEHIDGFRQRAEGRPRAAELALDFFERAGFLETTQRTDDRIEQEQQHQQAVLIEMQLSIAGPVALAAHGMQLFQQRRKPIEVLEGRELTLVESRFLVGHKPPPLTSSG